MTKAAAASAREYVLGLELPEAGPSLEGVRGIGAGGEVKFTEEAQAVVVGGQIAEFTEAVPPALREAISDGMLLAQLAANKASAQSGDIFRWYDKYVEVLQNIGWQLHDFDFRQQQIDNQDLNVHEAIVPVITAMLGPHVAAASIVMSVLQGLKDMDRSRPWITLFDRESQHAEGAKFQVAYVDVDAGGEPQIALLCFGIRAQRTITQVLFFKFSADKAEVKKAEGKLGVSLARLNAAKEALSARVAPFVADFVKNVDI